MIQKKRFESSNRSSSQTSPRMSSRPKFDLGYEPKSTPKPKLESQLPLLKIPRSLRVFMCHSHSDKSSVRRLYNRLKKRNIDPWFDERKLLPGQDWRFEITKALRASDVVLVCLSSKSVDKQGYIQKEIAFALDIADEQPEGAIFIIPIKLEECNAPERLLRWQWLNLYEKNGYERLMYVLQQRANKLGLAVS